MDQALLETALKHQAVIFDFDGVLAKVHVDWNSLKKELRTLIAKETGSCEELTPFDVQLNKCLMQMPSELTAQVNRVIESYELSGRERHQIYPEMIDFARILHDNNISLFICSSNTKKVIDQILTSAGIRSTFQQIISRENVQQRKPSPEGLLKIIGENKLEKSQVLYIGDREIDLQAGEAARIRVVLVHPRPHSFD